MRIWYSLVAVLVGVSLVSAQERQRPARGFDPTEPTRLLQNPLIQRELKITDEQQQKIQEAIKKAMAETLTAEQQKRLEQIRLQQRGLEAFADEDVVKSLKLSDEQKDKIKAINDEVRQATRDAFQGGQGNRREVFQKLQEARKKAEEKVQGVLSEEQKKTWKDMTGEPFEGSRFGSPPAGRGRPGAPPRRPATRDNGK